MRTMRYTILLIAGLACGIQAHNVTTLEQTPTTGNAVKSTCATGAGLYLELGAMRVCAEEIGLYDTDYFYSMISGLTIGTISTVIHYWLQRLNHDAYASKISSSTYIIKAIMALYDACIVANSNYDDYNKRSSQAALAFNAESLAAQALGEYIASSS